MNKNVVLLTVFLIFVCSLFRAQVISDENIVLSLDFNNSELIDNSIYNQTIINHETIFDTGVDSEGISLDGENDYLEVSVSESLGLDEQVTSSIWYKHKDQEKTGFYSLIEQSANELGGHSRYGTWVFSNNRLQTCIEPDKCLSSIVCQRCVSTVADFEMKEGEWYHVVSSYNGKELKIYVNGELNNSQSYDSTGISVRSYPLTIGTDVYDGNPTYLEGVLDEIMLFNIALNETQVVDLYDEFEITSTDIKEELLGLGLYPNPTTDIVNFSEEKEWILRSHDGTLLGRGLGDFLSVGEYKSGIYFVEIDKTFFKLIKP